MTPTEFCYWLRGFVELQGAGPGSPPPNDQQWAMIKSHLEMAFNKVIPETTLQPYLPPPLHETKKKIPYGPLIC